MKLIIRESNGNLREQEITADMHITPTQGEHMYFTGVEKYTFSLTEDDNTMNVYFVNKDGETVNLVLHNMAQLIQQNDPLDPFSIDTVFGVSTNEAGDKEIELALNNKEFESGEIIEALKEALSMDGSTQAGGAVIDDFQALLDNLEATAAGGLEGTAYLSEEDERDEENVEAQEDAQANPDSPEDPNTPDGPDGPPTLYTSTTLSISGMELVYEGEEATYQLSVTEAPFQDMVVQINISDITTNGDVVNQTISVTIPAGSTTSLPFSIDNVDDHIKENPEDYLVSITGNTSGGFDQVDYGQTSVTTTIIDDVPTNPPGAEDTVTISIVPTDKDGNIIPESKVAEGETAYYKLVAKDPAGNIIEDALGNADVTFTDGTAVRTGTTTDGENDFEVLNITDQPLGEVFSADALDDYIADNGEKFNITITNPEAPAYENVILGDDKVVTTITDDSEPNTPYEPNDPKEPELDTVTVKLVALIDNGDGTFTEANANEVAEGNVAYYKAVLEDENGNRIDDNGTVKVEFVDVNGEAVGVSSQSKEDGTQDYDNDGQTVTLGVPFSTEAFDDYMADDGEIYNVQLVDYDPANEPNPFSNADKYENVDIDTTPVTTTILDNSNPNTPNDPQDGPEPDAEKVIIKVFAADENGNPLLSDPSDPNSEYLTINETPEGGDTYYVALAFAPESISFNATTVLDVQAGTVDFAFSDDNSTATTQDTLSAEGNDYTPQAGLTGIALGTAVKMDAEDDFWADNNETLEVSISNYAAPTTPVYEDVDVKDDGVTTTITDDTGTPNTPNDGPEGDHEAVQIKLVACDSQGNPILDANNNYTFANGVDEGAAAKYMAVAFSPTETTFSPTTQLTTQAGSVTVTTRDTNPVDAEGTENTQTTFDGSEDYVISIQTVELGKVFDVDTLEDYLDESDEKYEVVINDGSYSAPASGDVYENVNIDTTPVTTTIVDDDSLIALGDTNLATETGDEAKGYESEDSVDTISGKDDGQSASGNVIDTDSASNTNLNLSLTEVKFNGTTYTLPENGSDITIDGDYGTLTINSTGAYSYDVDEALTDSWNVGDNAVDSFSYTLTDGYNTDSANLDITVEGRDDAPEITSILANNRATHTIEGILDLDGDGNGDVVNPTDLLNGDGKNGQQFNEDNGNFKLNMGNANSSMSVDYHGGNAGYKNIIGFYEKDDQGNITDVKILYKDDINGFDRHSENLGTLNNLNGEVGFFIIPDGNKGALGDLLNTDNYQVSIDTTTNKVTFTDGNTTITPNKAYYTDNDMSTDGRDHAVVTMNDDGSLTIGMEDLPENSTDQDYDDVVFTIKPCVALSATNQIVTDIELSDVDDANLESAKVELTNFKVGDVLDGGDNSYGISVTITDGVVELSGTATVAQYEEVIESLTFDTTSEDRSVRNFEYTVFDGDKHSNTKEVSVDIGGCELNTYTPDVYVRISHDDITMEGNALSHTVELVYANGSPFVVPDGETITVNLVYEHHNDNTNQNWDDKTDKGDFDTLVKQVTITGGNSSIVFENDTAYNSGKEQDEYYTVKVASVDDSATDTNGQDSLLKDTNFVIENSSAKGEIVDVDHSVREDNSNTQEDGSWNINLLSNLDEVYQASDITSIKISGLPSDATLNGNFVDNGDGTYSVNSLADAQALGVTPALDSSTDISLSYEVTLSDGSTESFNQTITIKPEADQPWTLGELERDEVTYNDTLLEDAGWVSLDAGWTDDSNSSINYNELTASTGETGVGHLSESNTVVRFFNDSECNLPNGTKLRYEDENGATKTFTFNGSNTAVEIPADKLDTLQIRTPNNFNGEINMKIQTGVKDTDEDGGNTDTAWSDNGESNVVWGVADKLTLNVSGSADLNESLFSATSVMDYEDSGRDQQTGALLQKNDGSYDVSDAIDLEINFNRGKYTNTEVIEFEVQGIPNDTFIFDKDGNMLNPNGESVVKIVLDPSDSYTPTGNEIEFTSRNDFERFVENMKLVPAHDSNEDFTLTLYQKATEPSHDASVGGDSFKETTDTFEVQLFGVADEPVVSGTDSVIELVESGAWQEIPGFKIASGEEQHLSEEVYALLQNVSNDIGLRVVDSNGNEIFDALVLAKVGNDSKDWRIDNDTLSKIDSGEYSIQLKTPNADMSGELSFDVKVTVLDKDADAGQKTDTTVSDFTMEFSVKPAVESYNDSTVSGHEDTWISLGLSVAAKDDDMLIEDAYSFGGDDYDIKVEIPGLGTTAEDVQVKGDNLVIDGNIIYLNKEDLASLEVLAPKHSNEDISGIKFHRTLQDDMDDNSTTDTETKEIITEHNVNVIGVADGWDVDTDKDGNLEYDGFQVQDIPFNSTTTTTTLYTAYAYEGDGYESFESNGNITAANAAMTYVEGKGLGVGNQNGKEVGQQTSAFENNESLLLDFGKEISDLDFTITDVSTDSLNGSYIVYDEDRNILGEYDITTPFPDSLEGFRYITFDAYKANGMGHDNEFYVNIKSVDGVSVPPSSMLSGTVSTTTIEDTNETTSLANVITKNETVEDKYDLDTNGTITDNSESEYYIVRNQANLDNPNTTWMIQGGINAGGGVWIVPASALNAANIKILQLGAGDGSLDLEIVPVTKENDGDIKFDQAHEFTINYAGGTDTINTGIDGNGNPTVGINPPAITVDVKTDGLEDTEVSDVFENTTATNGADLSYVVNGATNGTIDTSGMYQLPDGSFVGTGAIDFSPDANFNGDAGLNVDIIATDSNGNQTVQSGEQVSIDIDPVLDNVTISADGGIEIDVGESIDLNLEIKSTDTDGSETISGDVTITTTGGEFSYNGVVTTSGSITVDASQVGDVKFVPSTYTHGKFDFEVTYTKVDTDANEPGNSVSTTETGAFSINLASQVDDIEVTLTPSTTEVVESQYYALDLNLNQHDSDGSEVASVSITGIPSALVIVGADGKEIGNYKDNKDGTVTCTLKGSEVTAGGLALVDTTATFGGTFTLDIEAYSLDKVTKEISIGSDSTTLSITPKASAIYEVDAGSAQNDNISGSEDNNGMALDLDVIMTDLDGSEKLQVTFGDFPEDGFKAVYGDNDTELTDTTYLTPDEAQSIKIVPPANFDGEFDLDIHVKTVELDENGVKVDELSTPVTETVHVSIASDGILEHDGNDGETIDLGSIIPNGKTYDEVDFTDNQSQRVELELDDIITITDDDNELVIKGDNGDIIDLGLDTDSDNDGNADWQKSENTREIDGETYTEYTNNTGSSAVKVYIDTDIDDGNII